MRKGLTAVLALLVSALLFACAPADGVDARTEAVPLNYGASIEAAKAEFAAVFAEFTDLEITDSSTMARTGDPRHLVIEFRYTAQEGAGVYGFEYALDAEGNPELLAQGEDVTVDALLGEE